ncbi:hypothetical protein ABEB36_003723 [Hypothenemus hampei]|uniref:Toll-like receptor 3 n=1 Tax=Hypothenemus hampei TaxID=57062 RepID=A0ABD1F408_HYPHA
MSKFTLVVTTVSLFKIVLGICFFETSTTWDEDWYNQRGIIDFSSIICHNTTVADFTYELFELNVDRQESTFLQLSISYSNFSFIRYLINPVHIHKNKKNYYDFSGLSLNYCGIEQIVKDAFKDFKNVTEIDLGYNEINNLYFVSFLPATVTKLNLTNNKIQNVNFDLFLNRLDALDLSFNRIIRLVFNNLGLFGSWLRRVQKILNLNNNNITEIEFLPIFPPAAESINDLQLNLANNNILRVNFNNTLFTIQLKLLNLSNSLHNIEIFPFNLLLPNILDVSDNVGLKLDKTYNFAFLNSINFSNCSIDNINSRIFQGNSYEYLNFSGNNLGLIKDAIFAESYIQELDLSYTKFKNVQYMFQNCKLNRLHLSGNNITILNSRSFINVNEILWLDLSFNNLTLYYNSFVNCKGLQFLNLGFSNISSLKGSTFTGLTDLRVLNLQNNLLKNLEPKIFKPLIKIQTINLSNNKLSILATQLFNSLPLKYIYLSGNQLERIESNAFCNITQLKVIQINNNTGENLKIENEAFYQLMNVNKLELRNCNLTEFNAKYFSETSIQNLDLRNNNLRHVDFTNHTEYIDLKEFDLTIKGDLKAKSFLKLIFLQKITFWDSEIHNWENRTFQGLFNLETLNFKNSKIEHICVGALHGLFTVTQLDFQNIFRGKNKIHSCTFKTLHSLKFLNLSYIGLRNLESLAFVGLENLKELNLKFNLINCFENLTFSGLDELEVLNLSFNNLSNLKADNFKGLNNLKVLNLNNNKIAEINIGAFQTFPKLETLSISHNNLTKFKIGAFSHLQSLETLNLENNSISNLLLESLLPLTSLKVLNLEFNNLKTIGHIDIVYQFINLRHMGIANNKWKCDYLADILLILKKRKIGYSALYPNFLDDNIEGIRCIDVCKFLFCLQDTHGIN